MEKTQELQKVADREEAFRKLEELIGCGKTFFLAGHLSPDADTIGSMLAIGSVLERLGKKIYLFSQDPVPRNIMFLPGVKNIRDSIPDEKFDAAILLECSTPERGGSIKTFLGRCCRTVVNIDHHKTASFYGDINIVDSLSSSTAEIIYQLFHNMKVDLTKDEAACMYTGMVTDTGRFQFAATTPRTLEIASQLMAVGFDFSRINQLVYSTKAMEALKLLGRALDSLRLLSDGRLAVITVTGSDLRELGASPEHTENVINYGLMPPSVKAVVMFREDPDKINVTFRSKGDFDVSAVASHFGGGGHKNASGCRVKLKLEDAQKQVVDYTLALLG